MNKFRIIAGFFLMAAMAMLATERAWSQSAKKQNVTLQSSEVEIRRSVFTGNEVRMGLLWAVEANCQGYPVPDVRIRKAPANGELEFREMNSVIEFKKEHARAHCNGKPITGVGVFYKSRSEFTGTERMEIEVDYKTGTTRRYVLLVDVR